MVSSQLEKRDLIMNLSVSREGDGLMSTSGKAEKAKHPAPQARLYTPIYRLYTPSIYCQRNSLDSLEDAWELLRNSSTESPLAQLLQPSSTFFATSWVLLVSYKTIFYLNRPLLPSRNATTHFPPYALSERVLSWWKPSFVRINLG